MDRNEAVKFIDSRSWYQTIKFEDDLKSRGCDWCGEMAWDTIKALLPPSLEGKRVLDLGCNAGLFCVRSAFLGAKEVVGIDWTGWRPDWDFEEQQVFVKNYFEEKYNKKLPITYISGKMEEILQTKDLGKFDYVLAIASIYYTSVPKETIEAITKISDNVILRLREECRIKLFTDLFKDNGYKEVKMIQEKCWERLKGRQIDDFYMYHFRK